MEFVIFIGVIAGMFLLGGAVTEVVGHIIDVVCDAEDIEDELLEN